MDQLPNAKIALDLCLELDPENKLVLQVAATYFQASGESKESLVYLKKLLKYNENDPYLWMNLTMILLDLGRRDEAGKALRKVERLGVPEDLSENYQELKRLLF